ncbi:MAG: hypothetical protein QGH39_02450 [Candidatus Thermoplasmatota archaeon]|nr:hypothetical protein [Candidatus Thermoplasmatota archaeon]
MHIQKSAEVIVAARDSAKSVSSNCDFANVVKLQTLMHQRCIWSFRGVTRKASNYFRNLTAHLRASQTSR